MRLQQFEVEDLAHFSYLVACPEAGVAAVVDPKRDVDTYLEFAATHRLEITYVLETHIHADYASGARELAHQTGARLCLSGYDAGQRYRIAFPHQDLEHGQTLEVGSVQIRALHTPGHTPEHLSFLVFDTLRSETVPLLLLSGDFLFVGSLGRPDLLGEEEKPGLARRLFQSVRGQLKGLPDGLEIYPAHGAGSLCGAGMSARPLSTLGYERISNPFLDAGLSEKTFVRQIFSRLPPFPPYYRRMKQFNSEGPPILNGLPGNRSLPVDEFRRFMEADHLVIDVRQPGDYGQGHIAGAFGIGLSGGLSAWAAWVIPYQTPLLLVAETPEEARAASRRLVRVGLDQIGGYLAGGMQAWREAGCPLRQTMQLPVENLHRRMQQGPIQVLDVRTREEWQAGHIDGSLNIMAGELPQRLDEVSAHHGPRALVCGSGYRSTVAASVLERSGISDVFNVEGGMTAWQKARLPLSSSQPE